MTTKRKSQENLITKLQHFWFSEVKKAYIIFYGHAILATLPIGKIQVPMFKVYGLNRQIDLWLKGGTQPAWSRDFWLASA